MFIETASWIRGQLAALDLRPGARAADIGSSTLHYRTVDQPHVENEVLEPLRAMGVQIVHSDVKEDEGVDVVFDVSDQSADPTSVIGENFDLVLSVGMLQVIPDWRRGVEVLTELVRPGGHVIVESPHVFRRVFDPEDNLWRPDPQQLANAFMSIADFELTSSASIRIDSELQYRGFVSRPSWTPIAGRWWLPVPGFSERIRFRVPRWRWRDSIVVLKRGESS